MLCSKALEGARARLAASKKEHEEEVVLLSHKLHQLCDENAGLKSLCATLDGVHR
jgi:hypothetical protein